jgi:hypothetical protein
MKKLMALILVIAFVACKKKKTTDTVDNTQTTQPPPQNTPPPPPTIYNNNWQLYAYNNSTVTTVCVGDYFDNNSIGDIYRFNKGGQSLFTIDQGATKTYSTDPTILTGYWDSSGDLLEFTNNGYALACNCPMNANQSSKWAQYKIIELKTDTLIIKSYCGEDYIYFHLLH